MTFLEVLSLGVPELLWLATIISSMLFLWALATIVLNVNLFI